MCGFQKRYAFPGGSLAKNYCLLQEVGRVQGLQALEKLISRRLNITMQYIYPGARQVFDNPKRTEIWHGTSVGAYKMLLILLLGCTAASILAAIVWGEWNGSGRKYYWYAAFCIALCGLHDFGLAVWYARRADEVVYH